MTTQTTTTAQAAAIEMHRTSGWQIIHSKLAPITFALRCKDGTRVGLKAWRGTKSHKPAFYYGFSNIQRAEIYAAEYVRTQKERLDREAAALAERQAKRANLKASDFWKVGDTVYTSWGYDQTNVDFFQIIEVKPRSVVVRQVLVNSSDHGQPGGGKCAPRRYEYKGEAIFCPIDIHGGFSAGPCHGKSRPSYRHACYKWDGSAKYTSSDR